MPKVGPDHVWRRLRARRSALSHTSGMRGATAAHYINYTLKQVRWVGEQLADHHAEASFSWIADVADLNEGRDALAAAHDAHLEAQFERELQLEDWIDGGAP